MLMTNFGVVIFNVGFLETADTVRAKLSSNAPDGEPSQVMVDSLLQFSTAIRVPRSHIAGCVSTAGPYLWGYGFATGNHKFGDDTVIVVTRQGFGSSDWNTTFESQLTDDGDYCRKPSFPLPL